MSRIECVFYLHVSFASENPLSLVANIKNDKSFNVISSTTLSDPQSKKKLLDCHSKTTESSTALGLRIQKLTATIDFTDITSRSIFFNMLIALLCIRCKLIFNTLASWTIFQILLKPSLEVFSTVVNLI